MGACDSPWLLLSSRRSARRGGGGDGLPRRRLLRVILPPRFGVRGGGCVLVMLVLVLLLLLVIGCPRLLVRCRLLLLVKCLLRCRFNGCTRRWRTRRTGRGLTPGCGAGVSLLVLTRRRRRRRVVLAPRFGVRVRGGGRLLLPTHLSWVYPSLTLLLSPKTQTSR